ncbi:MAG: hypothetical protein WCC94_03025 [Candidatus Bathyarchaeia archaeon]
MSLLLPSFVGLPSRLRCFFCGAIRERLAILENCSGVIIYLCFHGCQHFPEPFRDTGLVDDWTRIDPWQNVKRHQPKLQKQFRNWQELARQRSIGDVS